MEKEFIPYEQALIFKELGFDNLCLAYYNDKKYFLPIEEGIQNSNLNKPDMHNQYCAAPLWQQAFEWFRNIDTRLHTINIDLSDNLKDKIYIYTIEDHLGSIVDRSEEYSSYNEARLACLKKLMEL